MIDFLHLKRVKLLSCLTQVCTWHPDSPHFDDANAGTTMIAKMARFKWEIAYIEGETRAYALLEGTGLALRFLGHIHERGRVIGVLLEKVDGRFAGIEDLGICRAALEQLHARGILHGDCNRHKFAVGRNDKVTMIDFEKSTTNGVRSEAMAAELASLDTQLREETGRGGGFM